jgi:hypothetical protein
MSICKRCGYFGGYHNAYCPAPHAADMYITVRTNNTTIQKAETK